MKHLSIHPATAAAALAVTAALGTLAGAAIQGGQPAHTVQGPTKYASPNAVTCAAAFDHARAFIANGRQDWAEAQSLIEAGRLSASTKPEDVAKARTTVQYLDMAISAREDILETAEAQFYAAAKECKP